MENKHLGDQFPHINGETLGVDEKYTVKKVWGSYTDFYRTNTVVFKTIQVNPHQRLSLQSHSGRSELWHVQEGSCTCELDEKTIVLEEGDSILIPTGSKHRLSNHTETLCIVAEMQYGQCSEEDIIRYEDDYGRS